MTRREIREFMQGLAEYYGLRYDAESQGYLGIHRGILIHLTESSGVVRVLCSPEGAPFGPTIAEAFAGFHYCEQGGLPLEWLELTLLPIRGAPKGQPAHRACQVTVGENRLEHLGRTRFMALPELIVRDLHEHGAPDSARCMGCGEQAATEAVLFQGAYATVCSTCSEAARHLAPPEKSLLRRWLIPFVALAGILLLIVYLSREPEEPPGASSYNRGVRALESGGYDAAIAALTEAIRLAPTDAWAHAARGEAYRLKGEDDRAIADCSEAIRLDPKHAFAYATRGAAHSSKGDPDAAIRDCTEAIRLDPEYAFAYAIRGAAHFHKGDCDAAIPDCTEAIRLDAELTLAYVTRAAARNLEGEPDQAIADCTEAIRLDPKHAWAYAVRGEAHRLKGEDDQAIADCSEAVRLDPELAAAYATRGGAHWAKDEHDRAIADCSEAIRLDPRDAFAYRIRSLAYCDKRNYGGALADAGRAIDLLPDALSHACRAAVHTRRGDVAAAIRDYGTAVKLELTNGNYLTLRGWAYIRKGDLPKALADLNRAIELSPDAHSHHARAWAFFHSGDLTRAEQDARKALTLDPGHAWVRAVLFRIEVARGRRAEATKAAREFLRNPPADADARRAHLVLRYFLGGVPLATLRSHPHWCDFEVAVRGYTPASPEPAAPGRDR